MGMNLQSCCHRCKVRVFHYRGRENETLLPFYRKHYFCMVLNPKNIETLEDQIQEESWMSLYIDETDGYRRRGKVRKSEESFIKLLALKHKDKLLGELKGNF